MSEPPPKPIPPAMIVVAVLIVAWCVFLAFFGPGPGRGGGTEPSLAPSAMQADYNWRLRDLDGNPVDFSLFQGKAVFLNIWATWCPPCVQELPSIDKLANNPDLKDVAFLCVSDENPTTVRSFIKRRGLTVPVYIAEGSPPRVYRTEGIPATFLIAPDGRIASAEVGGADWNSRKVVDRLSALAAEKTTLKLR